MLGTSCDSPLVVFHAITEGSSRYDSEQRSTLDQAPAENERTQD